MRPRERPRPLRAAATPSQQRVSSEGPRIAEGRQIGLSSDDSSLVSGHPCGMALGAARLGQSKICKRENLNPARTDDFAEPLDHLLVTAREDDPRRLIQFVRTVGGARSTFWYARGRQLRAGYRSVRRLATTKAGVTAIKCSLANLVVGHKGR